MKGISTTNIIIVILVILVIIGIIVYAPQNDQQNENGNNDTTEKDEEKLEVVGINVTTTWLGIGVPQYVNEDIRSLADLASDAGETFGENVSFNITGIEPGAGIMINTEKAMEEYGLGDAGWNLQESSSAAMLSALQSATENEEPIIATVWEPHAAFSVADIRKLEDEQNIYNNPEETRAFLEEYAPEYADAEVQSDVIATVAYNGFAEDAPAAYAFFQNFNVPASTQSDWIYQYSVEENSASGTAERYISENSDAIDEWMPGSSTELGKDKIVIGIPPWPGATVKSHVVAQILQDIGYETEIQESDAGVIYTGIANKEIDLTVAGWLPSTHADYWAKFQNTEDGSDDSENGEEQ